MIIFSLADGRKSLYQWDSNVQVEIIAETGKTVTEAHFAYLGASGESLSVEVSEKDGKYYAYVPNILLQKARKIICYAYVSSEDGNKTIAHHFFNVIPRQKPADYVYTETEIKNWSILEKRIEALENNGGGSGGSGGITTETDPTVPNWAKQPTKPTYTADEVGAEPSGAVSNHNTSSDAHNDIRLLVSELTSRLNSLADSDDTTLDQLSEIVAYIKNNKSLIDSITTGKVSVSDIIDNLTTNVANKPLSASQGVALKALIDGITIPEKLPNPQALTFTGAVTDTYDGSEAKTINIPSGGSGGSEYALPIAKSDTLGGVKPVAKTETMTQEVGVDENGGLFTNQEWELIAHKSYENFQTNTKIVETIDGLKDAGWRDLFVVVKATFPIYDTDGVTELDTQAINLRNFMVGGIGLIYYVEMKQSSSSKRFSYLGGKMKTLERTENYNRISFQYYLGLAKNLFNILSDSDVDFSTLCSENSISNAISTENLCEIPKSNIFVDDKIQIWTNVYKGILTGFEFYLLGRR